MDDHHDLFAVDVLIGIGSDKAVGSSEEVEGGGGGVTASSTITFTSMIAVSSTSWMMGWSAGWLLVSFESLIECRDACSSIWMEEKRDHVSSLISIDTYFFVTGTWRYIR